MKIKALLYCCKQKPYLFNQNIYEFYDNKYIISTHKRHEKQDYILNGKIIIECDFEVEEIEKEVSSVVEDWYSKELLKKSCLNAFDLDDYLKDNKGYAINVKNLNIFDKPRELNDCEKEPKPIFDFTDNYYDDNYYDLSHITKAPQNMCKVKLDGKPYVLISIKPQEMCRIINKEQTTLVRRNVLKEILDND